MKNKNFGLTSSDCDPIKKYKGNISDNNVYRESDIHDLYDTSILIK